MNFYEKQLRFGWDRVEEQWKFVEKWSTFGRVCKDLIKIRSKL